MNPISRFLMRRAAMRAARGERNQTPPVRLPPSYPPYQFAERVEPEACIPLEPWPVIDPRMLETKEQP
jgi:hypothetical protein